MNIETGLACEQVFEMAACKPVYPLVQILEILLKGCP